MHPKKRMIITGLLVVLLGLTVGVGAVVAYFSSTSQTDFNRIHTGRLDIWVTQPEALAEAQWIPGESRVIEWEVLNSGTVDAYIKGKLDVTWDAVELDPSVVMIEDVEYFDGTTWQSLSDTTLRSGDEFLYSSDGSESGLIAFPEGTIPFRMTITLDPLVGNEYQNAGFAGQIKMIGRQTTSGAEWGSY